LLWIEALAVDRSSAAASGNSRADKHADQHGDRAESGGTDQ
jgi:hypothetical protein